MIQNERDTKEFKSAYTWPSYTAYGNAVKNLSMSDIVNCKNDQTLRGYARAHKCAFNSHAKGYLTDYLIGHLKYQINIDEHNNDNDEDYDILQT